jgi:hypothetical protein
MARIGEQIDEREIVPVEEPFAPAEPDRAPVQPAMPEPV